MWFQLAAGVSLLTWIYLALGRGGFWRLARSLTPPPPLDPSAQRRVTVVIPARDEALVIARALTSLLEQQFSGELRIVIVDDGSADGTAAIAREKTAAYGAQSRVTVLTGQPLPAGWTGKLWAIHQGVELANRFAPDYLLLTDADIRHDRRNIAGLVARAEAASLDLTSYMVKLACRSPAEHLLIPPFVFFFLMLYPPAWIAAGRRRLAGAAGGCMLIRPDALRRIGGIPAIRQAVIDDCTLAQAVKRSGGRVWMGLTETTESLRSYDSAEEIGRMIARTAFVQLRHSKLLLAGTLGGLILTYVIPPAALLLGSRRLTRAAGGAAWLVMSLCYLPTVRLYKRNVLWAISLPFAAVFYAWATFQSAINYWRRKGGWWKGRAQDLRVG